MIVPQNQGRTPAATNNHGRYGRWLLSTLLLIFVIAAAGYAIATRYKAELRTAVFDTVNQHTDLQRVTSEDIQSYIDTNAIPRPAGQTQPAISGPLRVHPTNPRYFADANGDIVYLTGSHTWLNLQDGVLTDPPPAFDYTAYLDFLEAHNHNFFRLWTWEQAKWVVEWGSPYYFAPMPFQRTGPGNALDGKPRFDVTKFDQAYFDRLRERVIEAGDRGMYVSIMLFNGWSTDYPKGFYALANPWVGHPFNAANNINGIDGDPNNTDSGFLTHSLAMSEVLAVQEAYVKKVIDTVNDLDNVLYEISNESHGGSETWQYYMIDVIRQYEAGLPKQHPVGMTVEWPGGGNNDLFNSDADWISPNEYFDPPPSDGSKVIIADTDHIWGIGGDRQWAWKSFTRGINPIFMDQYDDGYKLDGGGYDMNNPNDVSLRQNMGYTRSYADRVNLAAMTPRGDLCSTTYCLANPAESGAEYIVYAPNGGSFTVDLSATAGTLNVEWFNPATGAATTGTTADGGATRSFSAPFSGDAVLYLYQEAAPPPDLPIKNYLPLVSQKDRVPTTAVTAHNCPAASSARRQDAAQVSQR